jgi:hypothetical protein
MFDNVPVKPEELARPPVDRHAAAGLLSGALTREAALALLEEAVANRDDVRRYRALVARLRVLVDEIPE